MYGFEALETYYYTSEQIVHNAQVCIIIIFI